LLGFWKGHQKRGKTKKRVSQVEMPFGQGGSWKPKEGLKPKTRRRRKPGKGMGLNRIAILLARRDEKEKSLVIDLRGEGKRKGRIKINTHLVKLSKKGCGLLRGGEIISFKNQLMWKNKEKQRKITLKIGAEMASWKKISLGV